MEKSIEKKGMSTGAKVGIGVGIGCLVIILIVIVSIAGCFKVVDKAVKDSSSSTSPNASEEVKTVKVNENLQVGDVAWKVLEVSKEASIGDNQYSKATASGVFVVIKIGAELTGKTSGTVDSTQFEVIDSQNRTFKASTEGQTALIMSGKEELFLKQVNPNVPIQGYIVFDVAKDAAGLKLKIKDLVFTSDKYGFVDLGI